MVSQGSASTLVQNAFHWGCHCYAQNNSPALLLGLVGHLIRDDILGTFGVLCR